MWDSCNHFLQWKLEKWKIDNSISRDFTTEWSLFNSVRLKTPEKFNTTDCSKKGIRRWKRENYFPPWKFRKSQWSLKTLKLEKTCRKEENTKSFPDDFITYWWKLNMLSRFHVMIFSCCLPTPSYSFGKDKKIVKFSSPFVYL